MTKGYQSTYSFSAEILPSSDSATPKLSRCVAVTQKQVNPFTFSRSPAGNVTMASVGGATLVSRRPSSRVLPRLRIARSYDDAFEGSEEILEEEEDVEEEGKQLFYNFVHDQIQAESPEAVRDIQIL